MLKLLTLVETEFQFPLRFKLLTSTSLTLLRKEDRYWSRFFKYFCRFLYNNRCVYDTLVPVVDYVDAIFKRYCKAPALRLLPKLSNVNFNLQIKNLAQLAGWTELVPRLRQRQGRVMEIKQKQGQPWRFCDQVSSHTMRRTTITSLLLLGVDESSVRSISGHSAGSRDFYRYVGLVQSLLDEKVRKAYETLLD